MRKLISALILAASAVPFASAGAQAHWIETRHNFGAFSEDDGPQTARFYLVNTGDEPLAIVSGRATCGCTTPKYPTRSIAPGDTATVEVTYDPGGRPGRFSKHVYIETTGEPRKSKLEVAGVVIGSAPTVGRRYPVDMGPLKLAQRALMLGEVYKDRLKTVYFDGYNRSADSLHIAIAYKPSWLDITVAPRVAPPGEQVSLIAYANSAKCPLYGLVEDSVTVEPAPGERYSLPVTLIVNEDFSRLSQKEIEKAPVAVLPRGAVDLGTLRRGEGPVTARFEIGNAGRDALKIRRIYTSERGVTISCKDETVKKGKNATVNVTLDPAAAQGDMLNVRVTVVTNDPLHPMQTVRVAAQLSYE